MSRQTRSSCNPAGQAASLPIFCGFNGVGIENRAQQAKLAACPTEPGDTSLSATTRHPDGRPCRRANLATSPSRRSSPRHGASQNRCDLSGLIAQTAQHSVDELRRDAGSLIGAGHLKNLGGGRIEFSNSLSSAEVETLAADSMLQVLQTASPVAPRTWDLLNDQLFARRPDVELRVYGFCGTVCDLTFLPRLTNMRDSERIPSGRRTGSSRSRLSTNWRAWESESTSSRASTFSNNCRPRRCETCISQPQSRKSRAWLRLPVSIICGRSTSKGSKKRSR